MSEVKKLCDFPEEILELVFLRLPGNDIPDLTIVSPAINDVISNSVLLMKNFEIYWKKVEQEPKLTLKSKRKYVNFSIEDTTGATSLLLKFIESHSLTLSSLNFHQCEFERHELVRMMSLVAGSLKTLRMCFVKINGTSSSLQCFKIVMPNLVEAKLYDGSASFFQIVEAKNLLRLECNDDHEFSSDEATHFIKFLGAIEELNSLDLFANAIKALSENPETCTTMMFKASRIELWLNEDPDDARSLNSQALTSSSIKFLQSQRSSLNDLTLCRCVLNDRDVMQIMSFTIKKLTLSGCEFIWNRTFKVNNKTIESIIISGTDLDSDQNLHAICDIFTGCHSASSVQFSDNAIPFDLALELVYNMPQLKKLELDNCDFEPINYPTIESMEINYCEVEDIIRLIRINRHLKSLKVDRKCQDSPDFHRALAELANTEVEYI